jgi:hypothetical protein
MVVTHRFIGFPSFFVCRFTTRFFVSEFKVLEFVDAYPFPVFYLVAEPRNFVVIYIKQVKGALRLRVKWSVKTT